MLFYLAISIQRSVCVVGFCFVVLWCLSMGFWGLRLWGVGLQPFHVRLFLTAGIEGFGLANSGRCAGVSPAYKRLLAEFDLGCHVL